MHKYELKVFHADTDCYKVVWHGNYLRYLEKARLLKIGYDKISELTQGEEYAKNPRKYSKELSFLNNIKRVLSEINEPTQEIEKLIEETYSKMRENGLGWLLDNLPDKKD